jgi:hypothetical protein
MEKRRDLAEAQQSKPLKIALIRGFVLESAVGGRRKIDLDCTHKRVAKSLRYLMVLSFLPCTGNLAII